jgi:single-strand DNA-binding protein
MARGINKVIIIGNVGNDPEIRYMPNGGAVTSLSLATSESWKDKQTGEAQERTEWHRVVFYNRLAEIAGEYLRKGSSCYVEGRLSTRKWKDKNEVERYTTEIIASEMQMLGGKKSGASEDFESPGATHRSSAPAAGQHEMPSSPSAPASFDDDIPF